MIWIVGNRGAGKTTLAWRLASSSAYKKGAVVLDGDALRAIWPGLGFSRDDRREQNLRAGRLAAELEAQGLEVIVATICPYRELREELTRLHAPRWIILPGGAPHEEDQPFEL